MAYEVFISYARGDEGLVRRVSELVKKSGGTPLRLDPAPGAIIPLGILRALRGSDAVIAIVTKESAQSASLNSELGAAAALEKKILLVGDGVRRKELPPTLRSFQLARAEEVGQRLTKLFRESPAIYRDHRVKKSRSARTKCR